MDSFDLVDGQLFTEKKPRKRLEEQRIPFVALMENGGKKGGKKVDEEAGRQNCVCGVVQTFLDGQEHCVRPIYSTNTFGCLGAV